MGDVVLASDPSDGARLWTESEELVQLCCRGAGSALDEGELIGAVCGAARRLIGAEGACVVLREGELVHYAREDAVAPLWAGQKFPIENCISGWSILHREPVVIEDIYADERIPAAYYRPTFVKSLAMQPIEPQSPIGAIGVYWSRPHRASARELALLAKLADVAALALESVALRRQVQTVRDDAAKAIRAKDEFLATVSHELRSPLQSILGWAELLRAKTPDGAVLTRALRVIEQNVAAQARLVEDLLELSRATSSKLELDARPLDLGRLVRIAADAVYPAAQAKGIHLETTIGPVGTVAGDEARLLQVLRNLLDNAIKFTAEGGHVRVAAARKRGSVRIVVSDDGIGIGAELLPFVFERHRQGNGGGRGLGLGLAVARQIVELHGGRIEARSDGEGRGATFVVELPRAGVQPARGASATARPAG